MSNISHKKTNIPFFSFYSETNATRHFIQFIGNWAMKQKSSVSVEALDDAIS